MGRPSRNPEAFRREAVQMSLAADTSWASVARRLGVNETTLRSWVHDHLAEEARAADPLKVSRSEFEALRSPLASNVTLESASCSSTS